MSPRLNPLCLLGLQPSWIAPRVSSRRRLLLFSFAGFVVPPAVLWPRGSERQCRRQTGAPPWILRERLGLPPRAQIPGTCRVRQRAWAEQTFARLWACYRLAVFDRGSA